MFSPAPLTPGRPRQARGGDRFERHACIAGDRTRSRRAQRPSRPLHSRRHDRCVTAVPTANTAPNRRSRLEPHVAQHLLSAADWASISGESSTTTTWYPARTSGLGERPGPGCSGHRRGYEHGGRLIWVPPSCLVAASIRLWHPDRRSRRESSLTIHDNEDDCTNYAIHRCHSASSWSALTEPAGISPRNR